MSGRILLIGASGYVGRRLYAHFGPERAIATFRTRPIPGGVRFDVLDQSLDTIVADPRMVSSAVIMLGQTSVDVCSARPDETGLVNVDGPCRLIDRLAQWGIPALFLSSDAVFDGRTGGYAEGDEPRPIITYGRQKKIVEEYALRKSGANAVLRLSKVYGTELGDGTFVTDCAQAILRGEPLRCAHDQVLCPIHARDVCTGVELVHASGLSGLFHLGGPTAMSRLDVANVIAARILEKRGISARIEPCSIDDFDCVEKRPHDTSMDSSRFHRLMARPLTTPRDAVREMFP